MDTTERAFYLFCAMLKREGAADPNSDEQRIRLAFALADVFETIEAERELAKPMPPIVAQ